MKTFASKKMTTKFKALTLIALTAAYISLPSFAFAEKLNSNQIEVNENIVHLGDIFNVNDIFAAEQLFQAPPVGRKGILTSAMLSKIALKYNLDWKNSENFEKVTITRKAKNIQLADIKNIITEHAIANQYIAGAANQTQIKLDKKFNSILIAASDYNYFSISNFSYQPYSDQFTVEFKYIKNGTRKKQRLSGKIENIVQVPVLANNIIRDQTILNSDIRYIQVNNRKVAQNIVLDISRIVGKSARSNIRAQQPIILSQLKTADLVKKNTIINLQFKMGRINLTIKARALTTGGKGAIIRVMNLKSNKQIDAIVTDIDQAMTMNSNQTNAKIASTN